MTRKLRKQTDEETNALSVSIANFKDKDVFIVLGMLSNIDALKRRQTQTAAELDALLPAVLERAFRGEL